MIEGPYHPLYQVSDSNFQPNCEIDSSQEVALISVKTWIGRNPIPTPSRQLELSQGDCPVQNATCLLLQRCSQEVPQLHQDSRILVV